MLQNYKGVPSNMGFIQDDKAAALSKMKNRKVICNGEATGYECEHYFPFGAKVESNDAEMLNFGERYRNCTVCPGYLIEFEGEENLPHTCHRYEPDAPILVKIGFKLKRLITGRKYDPSFEVYTPETPEQIAELTAKAHGKTNDEYLAEKIKIRDQNNKVVDWGDPLKPPEGGVVGAGVPGMTAPATPEQIATMFAKNEKRKQVQDDIVSALSVAAENQVVTPPEGIKVKGDAKSTLISGKEKSDDFKEDGTIFGSNKDSNDGG